MQAVFATLFVLLGVLPVTVLGFLLGRRYVRGPRGWWVGLFEDGLVTVDAPGASRVLRWGEVDQVRHLSTTYAIRSLGWLTRDVNTVHRVEFVLGSGEVLAFDPSTSNLMSLVHEGIRLHSAAVAAAWLERLRAGGQVDVSVPVPLRLSASGLTGLSGPGGSVTWGEITGISGHRGLDSEDGTVRLLGRTGGVLVSIPAGTGRTSLERAVPAVLEAMIKTGRRADLLTGAGHTDGLRGVDTAGDQPDAGQAAGGQVP